MDSAAVPARKTRWWFIIGALVVGAAVFVVCKFAIWHEESDERARRLSGLSPDECRQMLAECRQIIVDRGKYPVIHQDGGIDISKGPALVSSLGSDSVRVKNKVVELGFSTGKHFYGISAYAEGSNRSASEQDRRSHILELTPGLWLWEDADGYEVLKWGK